MINFAWDQFYLSWGQNEGSESMTGIPKRYIVKSIMVIGFITVLFAVIATIIRLYTFLRNRQPASDEALESLAIFSDQSTDLADAQRAAEELLEKERRAALEQEKNSP